MHVVIMASAHTCDSLIMTLILPVKQSLRKAGILKLQSELYNLCCTSDLINIIFWNPDNTHRSSLMPKVHLFNLSAQEKPIYVELSPEC